MKHWALSLLLLAALPMCAQTPAYTQSASFACNQQTCNGLPLDQGGHWQFILASDTFSLSNGGLYIFGNPGSSSGGISNAQNGIPMPANYNGAVGVEGTLTFDWAAVTSVANPVYYSGHAVVSGHQVRHCFRGCWDQMIVDSAQIYTDSVQ